MAASPRVRMAFTAGPGPGRSGRFSVYTTVASPPRNCRAISLPAYASRMERSVRPTAGGVLKKKGGVS
jgi:hypothetical protein